MPTIPTPNPIVFAFWSYDLFPHVLGSVGELLPNGDFASKSYGSTFLRKAIIAVYPVEMGKEILATLEAERSAMREAERQLHLKHLANAYKVLPELKAWRKANGQTPN